MEQWAYKNKEVLELPEDCVGFVYLITNNLNGKKYIGKKLATSTRRVERKVTLKSGVTKKKKVKQVKESDWREYYGSSQDLLEDIERLGKENFTREILIFCKTKGMMSYQEAKLQFEFDVLLKTSNFYNKQIAVRLNSNMFRSID